MKWGKYVAADGTGIAVVANGKELLPHEVMALMVLGGVASGKYAQRYETASHRDEGTFRQVVRLRHWGLVRYYVKRGTRDRAMYITAEGMKVYSQLRVLEEMGTFGTYQTPQYDNGIKVKGGK